jgi:hypothetical protein
MPRPQNTSSILSKTPQDTQFYTVNARASEYILHVLSKTPQDTPFYTVNAQENALKSNFTTLKRAVVKNYKKYPSC